MNIRIRTPLSVVGYELAAHLEGQQLGTVEVRIEDVEAYELRHRAGLPAAQVAALLRALAPFRPDFIHADAGLDGADVELALGDEGWLEDRAVELFCDSDELAEALTRQLADLGMQVAHDHRWVLEEDVLLTSEAPSLGPQVIRWLLRRRGIDLAEREQPPFEEVKLVARDPAQAGKPWRDRAGVRVIADDVQAGQRLLDALQAQGFRCLPLESMPAARASEGPILLDCGAFNDRRAPAELARLQSAVHGLLDELGVDRQRYPLELSDRNRDMDATIYLPVAACRSGHKRAYGGPYPERFAVTIHTDDPDTVAGLRQQLAAAGFDRVAVEQVASVLDEQEQEREEHEETFTFRQQQRLDGYAIRCGALADVPALAEAVRQAVESQMQALKVSPGFQLETIRDFAPDDPDVWISFPVQGSGDGRLLQRRTDPSRFSLKLFTPQPAEWASLIDELNGWGFANVEVEERASGPREVHFGGAPRELIDRLTTFIRDRTGLNLGQNRAWPTVDYDIYAFLPRRKAPAAATPAAPAAPAEGWRGSAVRQAAVERLKPYGRMLTDVDLSSRGPNVRKDAFQKLVVALSKMKRRNAIIAGPPGTGKTALVYELARRIQARDESLPAHLLDSDVFELSPTFLRAGTSYVGQYEKRVAGLLEVLQENPKIILFIDEVHSMFQSGRHERGPFTDANESFKGALARGEITVVGCTTMEEYRHAIAADGALARRFEMIVLDPPTSAETIEILRARRGRLEKHYSTLRIPDEMFVRAVELSDEYLPGRYQPDKAIQLLDQACAVCVTSSPPRPELTEEALYEALESATGQKLVRRQALTVEEVARRLRERIVGQDAVIDGLSKALVAGLGGWQTRSGPRGVFLFAGPTGVGKTETALALAEVLGGGRDALIRIDCNTLLSGGDGRTARSQLLGIPAGYIGYVRGQGGLLSRIRDRPEAVVLFDEFEKADRDVGELLLQVIDNGRVEDADANPLDFRRAFLVFTTNAGVRYETRQFGLPVGKSDDRPVTDLDDVKEELRQVGLGEEFLGRITHYFVFEALKPEVIDRIVRAQLTDLAGQARRRGMELVWQPELEAHLARQWQPRFGVRYLSTILRNRVVEQLSLADAQGLLRGVKTIQLRLLSAAPDAAGAAACKREGETLVICLA